MKRAAFLWGVAVFLGGSPARSNGRYPLANQLVTGPRDPSHIALRTTYGLVLSSDHGATWSWVCEKAAGFVNGEDPSVEVTEDDTIVVSSTATFSVSHDDGCSWSTGMEADQIVDTDVDRSNPRRAVAIASVFLDGGSGAGLLESVDNGRTWSALGTPFDVFPLTVALAPSSPLRVYASGTSGTAIAPTVSRSDDDGTSWTNLPLMLGDGLVPFLAAVDPHDANKVYVRAVSGGGDILAVSADGGANWQQLLKASGALFGFALSPDGKKIAVGGPADPLGVASTTDYQFKPVSDVRPSCLTWTADGLYACGDEAREGFALGLSADDGATFAPVFGLKALTLKQCAPTTEAGQWCPLAWPTITRLAEGDAGSRADGAADVGAGDVDAVASDVDASPEAPPETGSACALAPPFSRRPSFSPWATMALLLELRGRRARKRRAVDRPAIAAHRTL